MRWRAGIVFAGVAALAAPAVAMPADHPCIGPWVGVGKNSWDSEPWTIELTLTAAPTGTRCGTIEYPSLGCGGTLERCEVVAGDIETREIYTHGLEFCAPPAKVTIHCQHDRMRYVWDGPEDHVETMLRRPDGYRPPRPAMPDAATPAPPPAPPPTDPPKKGCSCSAHGDGALAPALFLVALAFRSRCCAWRAARARGSRAATDRSDRPAGASQRARGSAPSARSRRPSARRSAR